MRSRRLAAGVLAVGLLAAACGVEPQDAPEPLDVAPSGPPRTPTVSERPNPSPTPTAGEQSPLTPPAGG
ncbi:MAG: hypothetical protein M3N52_12450 [Actinomycetota bacterium]|nr:hypothetical protein [Actinomycetota bacterium]